MTATIENVLGTPPGATPPMRDRSMPPEAERLLQVTGAAPARLLPTARPRCGHSRCRTWSGRSPQSARRHRPPDAPSTASWLDAQQTSLTRTELAAALVRARPHLDRPDALIDGPPAEPTIPPSSSTAS